MDINYTRNDSFPISPLDIDFKRNEFSKWYGIDYKTGGYVNKSIFLEEWFGEEKEIFEMEKFIFGAGATKPEGFVAPPGG